MAATKISSAHSRQLWSPCQLYRHANLWNRSASLSRICRHPQVIGRSLSMSAAASSDDTTWAVVRGAEAFLQEVHSVTHLPWWAVILMSTVGLRSVITLPLAVHQNRVIAKRELLQPTLKEYGEAIKHRVVGRCHREGLPVEEANRRLRKEVRKMTMDLYAQEGCHPMKLALLPWVQIPLWVVLSFGLRNLSGAYPGAAVDAGIISSMSAEGILWFSNLALPDPFYILPVLLAGSNMINIEIHALRREKVSTIQRVTMPLFRMLSIGMGVVSSQLPSAMSLYWATSSCYGLLQNALLKIPDVRRMLGIPITPSESKTPFKDICHIFEERAKKFIARQK